jgi:DNA-binding response OmpR family regulator
MSSRTVLAIDNDESLVELLAYAFGEKGYTVYTAHDGTIGVELAVRHRPDAIICDLIMGEMHGFQVLQELRARPELRDTVVIVTSAKAYKPDIDRAKELGATEYMVKPFVVDELIAAVGRHLGDR